MIQTSPFVHLGRLALAGAMFTVLASPARAHTLTFSDFFLLPIAAGGGNPTQTALFSVPQSVGGVVWRDDSTPAPDPVPDPVPEPGTLVLLACGVGGLLARRGTRAHRGVMARASIQTGWAAAVLGCAAVLTGCSGPSPTSPTSITYENVAGNYTGDVDGVSQGVTIDGTLSLNLQQSGGVLSGGGTIVAKLDNFPDGQGTVTLAGTVASGPNPSINLTFRSVPCPSLTSDWSGSFESGSGVLTITGAINIANSSCVQLLSFPQTILLKR